MKWPLVLRHRDRTLSKDKRHTLRLSLLDWDVTPDDYAGTAVLDLTEWFDRVYRRQGPRAPAADAATGVLSASEYIGEEPEAPPLESASHDSSANAPTAPKVAAAEAEESDEADDEAASSFQRAKPTYWEPLLGAGCVCHAPRSISSMRPVASPPRTP